MIKVAAFLAILAVLWTGGCHTLYNILCSREGVPIKLSNVVYFAGPIGGLLFIIIALILIVIAFLGA